jgi:hypothetical protein
MIEALHYDYVIGALGLVLLVLIYGRFFRTMAGGLLRILFLITLATHSIEGLYPRPILLAMDGVLICGGLYAGTRETGITRIWSYFAAIVGVCLAIKTIFGIVLKAVT